MSVGHWRDGEREDDKSAVPNRGMRTPRGILRKFKEKLTKIINQNVMKKFTGFILFFSAWWYPSRKRLGTAVINEIILELTK